MLFIVLTTPASCISYTLLIAVAKSAIKHGSSPYAYLSGEERGITLGQYKQQSFVNSRKFNSMILGNPLKNLRYNRNLDD